MRAGNYKESKVKLDLTKFGEGEKISQHDVCVCVCVKRQKAAVIELPDSQPVA